MAIQEDRELRNTAIKCIEGEMRVKLLKELLKRGIGLREVEDFVRNERSKFRGGGLKKKLSLKKHREIVKKFMSEKLREAKGEGIKLRKLKKICLTKLETRLEFDKREFDRIKKEVKSQVNKTKEN